MNKIISFLALFLLWLASAPASGQTKTPQPPKAPTTEDSQIIEKPANESQNLLANGDFETPSSDASQPDCWQPVDNLVFYWTRDPNQPQRGKVIKIDTDVTQKQAYQWWVDRFIHGNPLKNAPQKLPTVEPKYDTIAGLDGGFFWSDIIEIKKGAAYKVYVDAKGPPAYVFLRGYVEKPVISFADECPSVQEQFRIARGQPLQDEKGRPIKYRLRYIYTTKFTVGGSDQWKTYTHAKPRHPTSRELTENVKYLRLCIYPYWPPAEYWFDNIRIYEVPPDPDQAKPDADAADLEEGKIMR